MDEVQLDLDTLQLLQVYLKQWEYDQQVYGAEVVLAFHEYYTALKHLHERLALCTLIAPYWAYFFCERELCE